MLNSLIIQVKDDKAIKILQSLKDTNMIDYIDIPMENAINELNEFKAKNSSKEESIFDIAGIWQDRDITIEKIRSKAWPKRR